MTSGDDYQDFYAQPLGQPAHNNPLPHAETRPTHASSLSSADQAVALGGMTLDPKYGYAGLVELANPIQRLGVFAIDFFGRIGLPLAVLSIVVPWFTPVSALEVWAGTAVYAGFMTLATNFDDDGVSAGCWIMGVRPVHAVNAMGQHGVAAVHWGKLIAHDFLAIFDFLLLPVLLRVVLTKHHQTLADSWTHVVYVPFNRRTGPSLLPDKERTWRLMA
jgi:uncharacterized RDD family membrane protein YckC